MNKILYVIAAATAILAVACKKDKVDPVKPNITWESNAGFGTVEWTNSLDAVVKVTAPAKFQDLKLVLNLGGFNNLANQYIQLSSNKSVSGKNGFTNPVMDLIGDEKSSSFANSLGMSVGSSLKNREETSLNLKAILDRILQGQEESIANNTTFSIDIQATDKNGFSVSKTARLHFTSAPSFDWRSNASFSVVDLDASPIDCKIDIWAPGKIEKLTVKLEDGAYPSFVERFKTRTPDGTTLFDLTSDANDKGAFSGDLPAKSSVADKDHVVLNFAFMYEEGIDMKSACTNTFTITVVDKNGKTVVNQAKFKKN
jgi:hypothetical protein